MSKKSTLRFNEDRALKLFAILTDYWRNKKGIFADITLPQDRYQLPANPIDAARWFFFAAITQRGGVVSEDPFKWLWSLWEKYPEMYDPQVVTHKWTPELIAEKFIEIVGVKKVVGQSEVTRQSLLWPGSDLKLPRRGRIRPKSQEKAFYKLEEFANSWHENALALARSWGGDLRNVFWGVTEFEEAYRRIDYKRAPEAVSFGGMRRKIFSLLTIWLQEKNLIPQFPGPIPVDFHAIRVLVSTGVIDKRAFSPFAPRKAEQESLRGRLSLQITERVTDEVALWSQRFCTKYGFSHMDINPAVWVLSRELCVEQLQNFGQENQDGSLILIDADELRRNSALWPAEYPDLCSHCPIESLCVRTLPNRPYYRWGVAMTADRVPYPHHELRGSVLPGIERQDLMRLVARKDKRA